MEGENLDFTSKSRVTSIAHKTAKVHALEKQFLPRQFVICPGEPSTLLFFEDD